MRFKQEIPTLQLSVQRGTSAVPDDGRYHILLKGEITFSSGSQKKALDYYKKERDRLFDIHGRPDPAEVTEADRERWLREQRLEYDLRAMSDELARTVVANARRKGGKGR